MIESEHYYGFLIGEWPSKSPTIWIAFFRKKRERRRERKRKDKPGREE